jgi:8-amino-7-oxononanoate synthase
MPNPLNWLDDALADLDRRDLRRKLKARTSPQRGDRIEIDGQSLVNFGSNDYLGLASDPRIAAAVCEAIHKYGWGSGASPLVSGRSGLHAELEKKFADFIGTEAALIFPSGYAANVGAITALVGKGDAIYSDELNHASIIDGCRLSGAAVYIYRHTDEKHLAQLIASTSGSGRRLIVSESLFSMDGDDAPMNALPAVADQHGAMLMIDEAHAIGIYGEHGEGHCEWYGVEKCVTVRTGSLSKALGSAGGFVAGTQRLIDWLANRARSYVFSTAPPAATAAAAIAALDIIRREPQRRLDLQSNAQKLRRQLGFKEMGHSTSTTHIIPVVIGDPARAVAASAELRRRGFFVPAIRPPSVPDGQSLLRISLTTMHTEQQINDLVAALAIVAR